MNLDECRNKIDQIDNEIVKLFLERMNISASVADYKKKNGMRTVQKSREREVLQRTALAAGDEMADYTRILFQTLMDLSKSYQNSRNMNKNGSIREKVNAAIKNTPKIFPEKATVACQGIDGAYSQIACDRIFKNANVVYVKSFEGVFSAVEKGLCRYGILPIENSIYGTVNEVYDLMKNYKFSIVKSLKLKINHVLLAMPGTKAEDIKEIVSHEQAIGQCSEFLKNYPNAKITVCENTAVAAKTVSERAENGVAAISSPDCALYYGLSVINDNVANSDSNFTRFICISKETEIYPGADRISIIMNLPNTPGSLYSVLSKFAASGVNLIKLESRPTSGGNFEFSFYFDLDASLYSDEVLSILDDLNSGDNKFMFLGGYSEK